LAPFINSKTCQSPVSKSLRVLSIFPSFSLRRRARLPPKQYFARALQLARLSIVAGLLAAFCPSPLIHPCTEVRASPRLVRRLCVGVKHSPTHQPAQPNIPQHNPTQPNLHQHTTSRGPKTLRLGIRLSTCIGIHLFTVVPSCQHVEPHVFSIQASISHRKKAHASSELANQWGCQGVEIIIASPTPAERHPLWHAPVLIVCPPVVIHFRAQRKSASIAVIFSFIGTC